jgi:hypothetical protein
VHKNKKTARVEATNSSVEFVAPARAKEDVTANLLASFAGGLDLNRDAGSG